MRAPLAVVVLVLLAAACTGGEQAGVGRRAGVAVASAEPEPEPTLEPSEPFGLADLTLTGPSGSVDLPVYVAADGTTRQRGLMDRTDLPAGAGMVFLFPSLHTGAFFMYRTRIPLSIAFFNQDGDIVAILDMEPCRATEPSECELYDPGVAYTGALEVNQGFFAEAGVSEDWTVVLPDDLPAASG